MEQKGQPFPYHPCKEYAHVPTVGWCLWLEWIVKCRWICHTWMLMGLHYEPLRQVWTVHSKNNYLCAKIRFIQDESLLVMCEVKKSLSGWWFQPSWKTFWSNWIIFPGKGENKKCLKPPPSFKWPSNWGNWGYFPPSDCVLNQPP